MATYFYNPELQKTTDGKYMITVYKYKWWYKRPRPMCSLIDKNYKKVLKWAKDYIALHK